MPAASEDLVDALAFALRFDGRKRKLDTGEMMARIVAERLCGIWRGALRHDEETADRRERVNRIRILTPPASITSKACRADRRLDPSPNHRPPAA